MGSKPPAIAPGTSASRSAFGVGKPVAPIAPGAAANTGVGPAAVAAAAAKSASASGVLKDSGTSLSAGSSQTSLNPETGTSSTGGTTGGADVQFNKSGRYQVLATLGSGGMGTVYKALDLRLGRFVAIKRLNAAEGAQPHQLEGFLREARVLAQLRHFNLPEIYDIDSDEHGVFISMEFIAGRTLLQEHKAGGKIPARKVLEFGEALCGALAVAHSKGVIHRDIKPSNVLLTGDGVAKLIDFGIAVAGTDAAGNDLTNRSSVAGTRSYSSPEQLADASKVDARSDIYSLGATLYALLSGDTPVNFKDHLLPEAARPLMRKAMAKAPAERFASMDEFRKAMRAVLDTDFDAPKAAPGAKPTGMAAVKADDRPLVTRLREEASEHQNAGRLQEAVGVWQRIAKLAGDDPYSKEQIERCKARIRQRDARRMLESVSRAAEAGRIDEAEAQVKEVFRSDPGNGEAVIWQDRLRKQRDKQIKKLYYDAKSWLHEGKLDLAQENCRKALALNRDSAMVPRLETLAAVCRTRAALKESDDARARGDKKEALAKAAEAHEHLGKAAALTKTDGIFDEVDKKLLSLRGSEHSDTDALFLRLYLIAGAPAFAALSAGSIMWGMAGLWWALGLGVPLLGAVWYVQRTVKTGKAEGGKLGGWIEDGMARQNENALFTWIAVGLWVGLPVLIFLSGLFGGAKDALGGK